MAAYDSTSPERFLTTLVPTATILQKARELGVVQRRRKVNAYSFLLVVVLMLCERGGQSIASMRRAFAVRTGTLLARSAFWRRFTPAFEDLVRWLLRELERLAMSRRPVLTGLTSVFRDVVAIDATVIVVNDALGGVWKGTRSNRPAALKVHTWVRALSGELLRHRITPEAFGDQRAFGFQRCFTKGVLFLFDRGYPSPSGWWRIHRQGGYFLTRLSASHDPVIVGVNRRHRGRARDLMHHQLRRALDGLQRQVLDVSCVFKVKIRGYGDKPARWKKVTFRVVALRNAETGEYHVYVTNVPVDLVAPEHLTDLYRLRWEVETFYKTGKSGLGLHELDTSKEHVVRTLVQAALVRACVTMQAKVRAETTLPKGRWINPGQWVRVWALAMNAVADSLLHPESPNVDWSWDLLGRLAMDPERRRVPTRQAVRYSSGADPRWKAG